MIAWYTIINSLLHAAIFPTFMNTSVGLRVLHVVGIPLQVAVGWALTSNAAHIIAGIAMLRQHNWGRLLYLGCVPVALSLTIVLYGFHLYDLVAVIPYGCFFVVLTRPRAVAFFTTLRRS